MMTEITKVWVDEAATLPDEGAFMPMPKPPRLPRNVRRLRDKKFRDWRTEGRLSRRPMHGGERKTLALVNDALSFENRTLHPTKGFRKATPKMGVVSLITQEMKNGRSWPMDRMKQAIIRAGER